MERIYARDEEDLIILKIAPALGKDRNPH